MKLSRYIWAFLLPTALAGCSDDGTVPTEGPAGVTGEPYLMEISVSKTARSVESRDGDGGEASDGEEIYDVEFIPDRSILYVSQRTRRMLPFQDGLPTYKYVYFKNDNADWDSDFNFKPSDSDPFNPEEEPNPNALDWDVVGSNGSVGNGFALYAMYYPDQIAGRETVAEDQSTLEALQQSDVMAAYHSTSALYSRVRFQLHHLMVYFKINLYVPVFGETWKTEGKNLENQGFSGYTAESLVDALLMNACPRFFVDWSASISSEASPAVNLPDGLTSADYKNIRMYSHAHDEETGVAIRPLKTMKIDISQFLPKDMLSIQPMEPDEEGKIYDDVFMYSFSVIVPAQQAEFTSQNPGFLKFAFKRPSTNTDKNYYFSSGFSSNSSTSVLEPNKCTLQVLNLYLPRKGDEVILVGAEIQEWQNVETDMNLPQKDKD